MGDNKMFQEKNNLSCSFFIFPQIFYKMDRKEDIEMGVDDWLKEMALLEEQLEENYSISEELSNQLEANYLVMKRLMINQIRLDSKMEQADDRLEKIRASLVLELIKEYHLDITELNYTEQDRLILMVKEKQYQLIDAVLKKKERGITFGSLN